ncbi:hypothetical protein I4F81_007380 [Pyropia yezoensis]|uniref:Uncharacterized protein n=1 Tax=Pyropia yezoensis TaxID=2788 RepID=A0ACC3C4X5_PYRYE|nr:hypothetical protein I4F81_007380 [Neopyropia yezoensis]|eukprot:contig_11558_g2757
MPVGEHIVVVGDPGAGKSTLLSTLCGRTGLFKSGISVGRGLTDRLRSEVVDGRLYSDTPGLNDPLMEQAAADAIAGAIQLGGNIKLVFVLTVESGRARQSNLDTIQRVLDALIEVGHDVRGRYTILFNKMTPDEMAISDVLLSESIPLLHTSEPGSNPYEVGKMLAIPRMSSVADVQDKMLPPELRREVEGVIEGVPAIPILKGTVVCMDSLEQRHEQAVRKLERSHHEDLSQQKQKIDADHEARLAAGVRSGGGRTSSSSPRRRRKSQGPWQSTGGGVCHS